MSEEQTGEEVQVEPLVSLPDPNVANDPNLASIKNITFKE